jgi:hypothetical protein
MTKVRVHPRKNERGKPPSATDSLAQQAKSVSVSAAGLVAEAGRAARAGIQKLRRTVAAVAVPSARRTARPANQRTRQRTGRKPKPGTRRAA